LTKRPRVGLTGVGGGLWRVGVSACVVDVLVGVCGGSGWDGFDDDEGGFEGSMAVEYDLMTCSDSRGVYSSNFKWYVA